MRSVGQSNDRVGPDPTGPTPAVRLTCGDRVLDGRSTRQSRRQVQFNAVARAAVGLRPVIPKTTTTDRITYTTALLLQLGTALEVCSGTRKAQDREGMETRLIAPRWRALSRVLSSVVQVYMNKRTTTQRPQFSVEVRKMNVS